MERAQNVLSRRDGEELSVFGQRGFERCGFGIEERPHPKTHCEAVRLCVSLKEVQGPLPAFRPNITNEKKRDRSNKGGGKNLGTICPARGEKQSLFHFVFGTPEKFFV